MAAPLTFRDSITGAMIVSRISREPFTVENLNLFVGFVQQAAIAIENARLYEQARRHAAELEERVAERTSELEAANEHLQALSRVKDEFVANVSHELRTPITNLKLYHELLQANPGGTSHYLATLQRETERLEHIIEDLLLLSRLDQDRIAFAPTVVDINALASEYVADRAPLADNRKLALSYVGGENIPEVLADQMMLGQAFSVLLANALAYTPPGGQVVVSTQTRHLDGKEWVGLSVSDTGPGIPPEDQPHLFQRFFRGQLGRDSGTPGIGLGLAIAKEIVEQHQGSIELASEGIPSQGATFTIWLPAYGG
jgi:signal transduction histidine kinase